MKTDLESSKAQFYEIHKSPNSLDPIDYLNDARSDDQMTCLLTECKTQSDTKLCTQFWTSKWYWNDLILKIMKVWYTNTSEIKDQTILTSTDHSNDLEKSQFQSQFMLMQV